MNKNDSKKISLQKGLLIVEKVLGLEQKPIGVVTYLIIDDTYILHKNRIYKNSARSFIEYPSVSLDAWMFLPAIPHAYIVLPKSLPFTYITDFCVACFKLIEEGKNHIVISSNVSERERGRL